MPARNIVIGQKVQGEIVELAKSFRHQMTPEEKILWQHLRANRLGGFHFRRQQVIDGYIVDLYCHAASLVVEVDSAVHKQQIERDVERDNKLSARGLCILRFKNEQVRNELGSVLAHILATCRERSSEH